MKKLTQAEKQIMQVLWSLKSGGYLKDFLELLDDPKPNNNTVGHSNKILVEKGFMGIKNPNRNNLYYPLVSKYSYSEQSIEGLTARHFEGSYSNVISFLSG